MIKTIKKLFTNKAETNFSDKSLSEQLIDVREQVEKLKDKKIDLARYK